MTIQQFKKIQLWELEGMNDGTPIFYSPAFILMPGGLDGRPCSHDLTDKDIQGLFARAAKEGREYAYYVVYPNRDMYKTANIYLANQENAKKIAALRVDYR